MGCFLACFGFKKKNKHRKPRNKCLSVEQNHGSYIPLDSEISLKFEEKHLASNSKVKKNATETSKSKIKKKVSFNLNVKAYEPIQNEEDDITAYFSEGEEETKWEINAQTSNMSSFTNQEKDSKSSIIQPYPQNYRYQNCRDSYDEEDEDLFNDLDFDDTEYSDEDEDDGYSIGSDDDETLIQDEEFPWKMDKESHNDVVTDQINEERNNARDRSRCVLSVLKPVENTSQWKAVKAKTKPMKGQKENVALDKQLSSRNCDSDTHGFQKMKNLNASETSGCGIAVDASLSNWLGYGSGQEVKQSKL